MLRLPRQIRAAETSKKRALLRKNSGRLFRQDVINIRNEILFVSCAFFKRKDRASITSDAGKVVYNSPVSPSDNSKKKCCIC